MEEATLLINRVMESRTANKSRRPIGKGSKRAKSELKGEEITLLPICK